jgi:uncharacterized protein YbaR (Trm112 family)
MSFVHTDIRMIHILVCPLTKTQLVYDQEKQELISHVSGLAYPIKNGIPIMLVDEARIINAEQVKLFAPHLVSRIG